MGPAMPAGLSLVRQDREATSRRGTARKGGIVGAARTAFTVRVNAGRRADASCAHPIRREGWPSGRIRVQGLEGSWPRPGAINLVQGSKGGRRLWSMGSRGERSLLLVVVQRRSAWPGWVSGGAGAPPPERMKRRTFLWCDEARCRGSATAWGMQRGRAAAPLPRLRCITPHILHVALSALHSVFR